MSECREQSSGWAPVCRTWQHSTVSFYRAVRLERKYVSQCTAGGKEYSESEFSFDLLRREIMNQARLGSKRAETETSEREQSTVLCLSAPVWLERVHLLWHLYTRPDPVTPHVRVWVVTGIEPEVRWVINKELWGGEIDDWPSQITHVEAYCLIKDYHSSRTKPSWYFSMCSSLDCLGFLRFARTPILDFNDTKSDKEEDVVLIIIVSVAQILVSRPPFGREPNLIFYESQVFHCYRFVTNDTDKFNQLWHHIIYRQGGIFNS